MKIVACIKQTFDSEASISLNENGGIDDQTVIQIVNPYDEYAVEEAIRLKEKYGGEVTVVTVGKEDTRKALHQCLAMGADHALLVNDPQLEDADSHTYAVVLSAVLCAMDYDLILCGREAIDTSASQVPSRLAECLDLPQINMVSHLEIVERNVKVTRDIEGGSEIVESVLPAVISVQKGINEVRYPSLRLIMRAKKMTIKTFSLTDLGLTMDDVAPYLSVEEYIFPEPRKEGIRFKGEVNEVVAQLIQHLHHEVRVL